MKKVLFVCTGNTCRSPMAACLMRSMASSRGLDCEADSAGLYASDGAPASIGAMNAMRLRGLSLSSHTAKPVTKRLLEQSDVIVCLTKEHERALKERFPSLADKVISFSPAIPDPYGGSQETYDKAAKAIESGLERLIADQQL